MTVAFTQECLRFLSAHLPERSTGGEFRWGEGSDDVAIFHDRPVGGVGSTGEALAEARAWQARRFDAGFGWIDGDPEYGGRGLGIGDAIAYAELEQRFQAPDQHWFGVSRGMVAPTITAEGTPAQKRAHLRALYRGDAIGCQLFSEPGAGSDLAGVATSAVPDGSGWVVNGQKVWTSGAHYSDLGLLLTRTEGTPQASRHRGLTMFLVDMASPGIEVRPLRQLTGGAHFNEVFLTDVRIPDTARLGEVGGGWAVAMTTLMGERASVGAGGGNATVGIVPTERLTGLLDSLGLLGDPAVRQELARVVMLARVSELTTERLIAAVPPGAVPGPELSAAKLMRSELVSRTAELVTRALGPAIAADTGRWGSFAWADYVLGAPALRLAGGTDEIIRNILGERVLGLPREARA